MQNFITQKDQCQTCPQKGSALVVIIITIVVISALAAAVVSLTGTGALDTVVYSNNKQAHYLAESGYRYAASLYLNTENQDDDGFADDEKAEALKKQIDQATYTMPDNKGQFTLAAFPYWCNTSSTYTGNASAAFDFPGQRPKNFDIPQKGVMAYGHPAGQDSENIILFSYRNGSVSDRQIKCQLQKLLPNGSPEITKKDNIYLGLLPNEDQMVSGGGSLELKLTSAKNHKCIPPYNGIFICGADASAEYIYEKAVFDGNRVTLRNISRLDGQPMTNVKFQKEANQLKFPVFKKNLHLLSTGKVGTGDLASVRSIDYYIPVSDSRPENEAVVANKNIIFKTTQDIRNNFDANNASYSVTTLTHAGGGEGLFAIITNIRADENGKKMGALSLKTGTVLHDKIKSAWANSNNTLGYDLQAKLSTGSKLIHAGLGLSFRVSPSRDEFLAVSMMKFHVPSLIYRKIQGGPENLAGGTLSGYRNGSLLFKDIRCLGDAMANRFYYKPDRSSSVQEREDGFERVAIHPDDYWKIQQNLNNRPINLKLTDSQGKTSWLGQTSYPHTYQGWWDENRTYGLFGPYKWQGYDDKIHQGIKPLVDNHRYGSMSDWWGTNNSNRYDLYYYNFFQYTNQMHRYSPYNENFFDRLALVLWEQYKDDHGNIKRRWLAVKDLTEDPYVKGIVSRYDGRMVTDSSVLLLRVRENRINGIKTNVLNVYYGDTQPYHPDGQENAIPYDKNRKKYESGRPTDPDGNWIPTWPPRSLAAWSAEKDYFTHIQASVSENSQWDMLNPEVTDLQIFRLEDDGSILISHLTTPDEYWDNRPEIAFHGLGNIVNANTNTAMTDFALRVLSPGSAGHLTGGFLPATQH